ncbi:protein-disulfide reductase DsbD domain-containing protein [Lacinutrix sp. 5H-3-7-4]|uniref:protein-disulfide reductase DsbD family protein n=1 Tax=Lacinutrix sp. (strain 5H-3-7-4) TaxID=983544 RepID=UPI00020A39CC|nr:protein-disulfide reductase DsbD domain-containing protein [Lacinutrix sp. 5H-3-7-4]AEH02084.1 Protein-disulfide reductase [Lacinutrix sp. 5H-3-7-4]
MKQFIAFILVLFSINSVTAQLNPVKWSTSVEKISDTDYNLIFNADIESKWHLYSQTLPEGGALPTAFTYNNEGEDYKVLGKTKESRSITKHDKVFDMDLTFFDDSATFTQRIELVNKNIIAIEAEVSFQACDDKQCIFESEILTFQLPTPNNIIGKQSNVLEPVKWTSKANKLSDTEYEIEYKAVIDGDWHFYSQENNADDGPIATEFTFDTESKDYEVIGETSESKSKKVFEDVFNMDVKYFEKEATFKQKIKLLNPEVKVIKAEVFFQVCDNEKCLAPETFEFQTSLSGDLLKSSGATQLSDYDIEQSKALALDIKGKEKFEKAEDVEEKSNLTIFFLGFLGGLIALLTPCVFPMIPLTVSFFTKSAGNSQKGIANSVMYGFFIFLIYFLLSLPFHVLDSLDPEILNNISTNVTLNIIFFIIFIAFAFSFFGYYELTLPHSWSAALDSKANSVGGLIGVFFMALTLAIVSFSCTGPILGTLLGSSLTSDGGATQLTMGMSGFGLALALPFTLFAMFPKWLNSLPKSGGWLTTVKVVLGFIEIALALKFLSNADLVKHWGLLKREVFIGLWIIVGIGLLLYLFGKIKFPHDGPYKKPTKWRWSFIFLVFAFTVYLIPGLTNTKYANLKMLSGFPPPLWYSIYEKESECPLGLNCYKDLNEGVAAAKASNKPIMLDFTGYACVNCRKMEEQVWSEDDIYNILNDEYIIISLYVDDRKELPENEQFKFLKSNGSLKSIKTIGDKWATLQTVTFQNNSQPFYVLLNHDMEMLNHTTAYTPNDEEYLEWLKKGLENFKKK